MTTEALKRFLSDIKIQGVCPFCKQPFGDAKTRAELDAQYKKHLETCEVAIKEEKEKKESYESLRKIVEISDSAGVSRKDLYKILAADEIVKDIKRVMKKHHLSLEEMRHELDQMELYEK